MKNKADLELEVSLEAVYGEEAPIHLNCCVDNFKGLCGAKLLGIRHLGDYLSCQECVEVDEAHPESDCERYGCPLDTPTDDTISSP